MGRQERLHASTASAMVTRFERHIARSDTSRVVPLYRLVPVTPAVLTLAAELCNTYWQQRPYPLRSLDAVQLACALAAAADLADELVVVTADMRLAAIAAHERFRVANPAEPPAPGPAPGG